MKKKYFIGIDISKHTLDVAFIVNELSSDYFKWADRTGVVDYDKIKPSQPMTIPGQTPVSSRRNND